MFHYFVSPSLPLAIVPIAGKTASPLVDVEPDACHGPTVVQLDSALIDSEVASHINAVTTTFNIVSIRFVLASGQRENHRYGHKHGH
jgi:hypothetical protein